MFPADLIFNEGFSITALARINYMRNCVAHNKIILESEKDNAHIKYIFNTSKNCLPEIYRQKIFGGCQKMQFRIKYS